MNLEQTESRNLRKNYNSVCSVLPTVPFLRKYFKKLPPIWKTGLAFFLKLYYTLATCQSGMRKWFTLEFS
ncbi:MAG: hypothetical protein LBT09_01380 [Planctomycetaceae bacterium]|nr:hypothetical protein [Planctomycetaceae bacterium]